MVLLSRLQTLAVHTLLCSASPATGVLWQPLFCTRHMLRFSIAIAALKYVLWSPPILPTRPITPGERHTRSVPCPAGGNRPPCPSTYIHHMTTHIMHAYICMRIHISGVYVYFKPKQRQHTPYTHQRQASQHTAVDPSPHRALPLSHTAAPRPGL